MDGTIDHLMVRVENLDESIEWYKTVFDYTEVRGRVEAETFTNVFLAPADRHPDSAYLELTYNHDGRSYNMGNAWDHFAVTVTDVENAFEELIDKGAAPHGSTTIDDPDSVYIVDPDGHKIQLVETDSETDWSLDHVTWNVTNIDESIGWLIRKFEYEFARRVEENGQSMYRLRANGAPAETFFIELRPTASDTAYEIGDAWGHVAMRVDDISTAWATLMDRGADRYRTPENCPGSYAVTKSNDGHECFITVEHLEEEIQF